MFPFYQRIVALFFVGVATIIIYAIWYSIYPEKKEEEPALKEIKDDLTGRNEEAKKTATEKPDVPENSAKIPDVPEKQTKIFTEVAVAPNETVETPKDAAITPVAEQVSAPEASSKASDASQTPSGEASTPAPAPTGAPKTSENVIIPLPQEISSGGLTDVTPVATVSLAGAPIVESITTSNPKVPTEAAPIQTYGHPETPDATPKSVEPAVTTPSVPIHSPTKDPESTVPGVPQGSRETAMPMEPPSKPLPPPIPAEPASVETPSVTPKPVDSTAGQGSSRLAITSGTISTAVGSEVEKSKVMRIHQCFCRPFGKSKPLEDEECVFDEKVKLKLKPTEINPISYSYYEPVSLINPIKKETSLAKEILTKPKKEKVDYLTPFNPILSAVEYAHQHVLMIEDLIGNKDFFDY